MKKSLSVLFYALAFANLLQAQTLDTIVVNNPEKVVVTHNDQKLGVLINGCKDDPAYKFERSLSVPDGVESISSISAGSSFGLVLDNPWLQKKNIFDMMMFEMGTGVSNANNKTRVFIADIKLGYKLTHYLNFFVENENGLHIIGDTEQRNVFSNSTIGGGISFDFLGARDNSLVFGLRTSVGATVGNVDNRYTVTKAGVYMRLGKHLLNPVLETGYRWAHSRTTGQYSVNGMYATLSVCW